MNLWQVRKYIAQECLDHVLHKKGNLVFNTFTGSGKTTTILKTLHESSDGLMWIYLAPYHAVIEENIELSNLVNYEDVIHLMGRDRLCVVKQYRKYAKMGINIQPFCENFCPKRNGNCPYYNALDSLKEMPCCFSGVHAHIPTLLQQLMFEEIYEDILFYKMYDVLIIDEFPMNTIFNQESALKKDITYARDVLEMSGVGGPEYMLIRKILDILSLSTKTIDIDYESLYKLFGNTKYDFELFKDKYDFAVLELVDEKKILGPPKDIIYMLIEIYKRNPTPEQLYWMIHKTKDSEWMKGMYFFTISNLSYFANIPIKIIALDGTADLNTWRHVIGKNTEAIKFDLEYRNTYQLIGARNPVSSIIRNNKLTKSGVNLVGLLEYICKYKKNTVLVCCSKRVENLVSSELEKKNIQNVMFANYYNLRSRNSYYERCDTCVLFHEPNVPPFQTKIITNVLELEDEIVSKINTEDEMKQGIGRSRINIPVTPNGRVREDVEIFIFSSTGYKKIVPEARYMSFDQMKTFAILGQKRLYFDEFMSVLKKVCPSTKRKLMTMLGISRNNLDYVLSVLEKRGMIKVEWGNVNIIRDETEEDREDFIIKFGGI